jgi:hypothetical protein
MNDRISASSRELSWRVLMRRARRTSARRYRSDLSHSANLRNDPRGSGKCASAAALLLEPPPEPPDLEETLTENRPRKRKLRFGCGFEGTFPHIEGVAGFPPAGLSASGCGLRGKSCCRTFLRAARSSVQSRPVALSGGPEFALPAHFFASVLSLVATALRFARGLACETAAPSMWSETARRSSARGLT